MSMSLYQRQYVINFFNYSFRGEYVIKDERKSESAVEILLINFRSVSMADSFFLLSFTTYSPRKELLM